MPTNPPPPPPRMKQERTTVQAIDELTQAVRDMHNVLCELLYMNSQEYAQKQAEELYEQILEEQEQSQQLDRPHKIGGVVKRK